MEEFHRKQLPLRQHKDKPTLKYSSTSTGQQHPGNPLGAYPTYPVKPSTSANSYVPESTALYHGSYSGLANDYSHHANGLSNMFGSQYSALYKSSAPQPAYGNYFFMTGSAAPTGMNLTPAQILAASIQTSTKVPSKNPFSRPISAQDVRPAEKPKTGAGASVSAAAGMMNTAATGSNSSISSVGSNCNQGNGSRVPSTAIQTNSFMRPQSALKTDASENLTNKHTPTGNISSSSTSTSAHSTGGNVSGNTSGSTSLETHSQPRAPVVNSPDFLMSQPIPRPPSAVKPQNTRPSSVTKSTASQNNSTSTVGTSHKTTLTPAATKIESNQNGMKPETRELLSIKNSQVPIATKPPTGPSAVVKRTNSTTPTNRFTDRFNRPGSGSTSGSRCSSRQSQQGSSRPGTPGSDSGPKVRNPNYTPSKPYSEVSDPTVSPTPSETESNSPTSEPAPTSKPIPANKTATPSANTSNHNNTVKDASHSRKTPKPELRKANTVPIMKTPATSKKMPVTNTVTRTVFYRKESKTEEVISDPRKPGAPAARAAATADRDGHVGDEDEEWTDEEEGGDKSPSERLPGDGADSATYREYDDDDDLDDDDDVDDDEAIDNLEDDFYDSDDDSDAVSITTSGASRRSSAAAIRVRSATRRLQNLAIQERRTSPVRSRPSTAKARSSSAASRASASSSDSEPQPALMPSLFPHVPPTVNFVQDGEKVDPLPWEFRKMLKWRMSPITPNVVKNCIARSGFRASKKNHDWLGYWGKHMKAQGFQAIRPYQKVNHFPGSFQIGRKDRLWRNLSKLQVHFGKKEYGFFPQTFVLPFDMKQLKRVWDEGGNKQKWIIKPPASARGIGIKVISKWNQIPKKRSVIVQRYLGRPYLINESKFDLRVYVYVTSYDPLRIYVYDDGLARFASCKYSYSMKNINNKYMHLTNYSINKKNQGYEANSDENICQGHKWGLKALWGYMKKQGVNTSAVWESIKDLVIRTIISSESCVNSMVKANVKRRYSCHELFGFDVMLDENLKPWIIEVNISPSLHSNSQLDMNIKGGMIKDLFNLAGFMLPDKADVTGPGATLYDHNKNVPPNPLVIDKRLYPTQMSPDERGKHAYYSQRYLDEFVQQTVLDTVTPDDLRMLVESVDEDSRRGNFQRVFPSHNSHKYLRFMDQPRYYNLLLNQWVQRYHRMEARGVALLESLCVQGIHLENPTDDPRHQWAPPSSTIPRELRTGSSAPMSAHGKAGSLPTLRKKKAVESAISMGSGVSAANSRPPTARSAGAMASS